MTSNELGPDPLDRPTTPAPGPLGPGGAGPYVPIPTATPSRNGRVVALGIVAVTAVTAPFLLVRSDRVDTAALFVGVPLVLAVIIALAPPAKSLHGLTFRVVTFGLLITSAFLHEGAACVLIAASAGPHSP